MVLNVKAKSSSPAGLAAAGPPFVQTNLFGGVGEVRVWSLLRGATEPFTAALSCELAAGGSVGPHKQEEYPELVLGIDGEGEASVDGVWQRVGPLSALYLPLGAVLEIVNRSQEQPLRYVIVKARGA
jgi:quercetin dioxygenase-like cupin family protein